MGLSNQILIEGDDSSSMRTGEEAGFTGSVDGGINELGNMFNYVGPCFLHYVLDHDANVKPNKSSAAWTALSKPFNPNSERKLLTQYYQAAFVALRFHDAVRRFRRADLLASFRYLTYDPRGSMPRSRVPQSNPGVLQRTASEYLCSRTRTVLISSPPPRVNK